MMLMLMMMVFAGYELWRDSYDEKETALLNADMLKRAAARRAGVLAVEAGKRKNKKDKDKDKTGDNVNAHTNDNDDHDG